jgi:hypothetical protein
MILEKITSLPFALVRATVSAQSSVHSVSLWKVSIANFNPIRVLRALEQLNKFRALDDAALLDAGLGHEDVERATLGDFLKTR